MLLGLQNFFWPVLVIFKEKATFSFICLRNARGELMNLSLLSKEMPSMGDHGINKGSLLTFSGWEGSNWNCHYLTIPWPHRMWYLGVLLLGLFPQWNLIGFFTVWMHSCCQLDSQRLQSEKITQWPRVFMFQLAAGGRIFFWCCYLFFFCTHNHTCSTRLYFCLCKLMKIVSEMFNLLLILSIEWDCKDRSL